MKLTEMNRRDFLKKTGATAAALSKMGLSPGVVKRIAVGSGLPSAHGAMLLPHPDHDYSPGFDADLRWAQKFIDTVKKVYPGSKILINDQGIVAMMSREDFERAALAIAQNLNELGEDADDCAHLENSVIGGPLTPGDPQSVYADLVVDPRVMTGSPLTDLVSDLWNHYGFKGSRPQNAPPVLR